MIKRGQLLKGRDKAWLRHLSSRQCVAVNRMVKARGGIVWWKVGEGKTRIGLFTFAALQVIYKWKLPSVCLIVCRRTAFYDWRDEIQLLFPKVSVYEDQIPAHPPSNRPVFLLVSTGEIVKRLESLVGNYCIRFVILDELWLYANHKSERSKAVAEITEGRISVGLSGTVMKARDTSEIYCQAKAVHKHGYLAPSLTRFKTKHQKGIIINDKFPKYYPKKGSFKKIMYDLRDAVDMHFPTGTRRITEQFHNIPPTKKQTQYFNELRELYSLQDFNVEYDHAIVISTKIQQIANGWVKVGDDDIRHVKSNKPDKLEDDLSDIIASGQRAVVWCAFRYDVEMLADRLSFASLQMLGGKAFDVDRWLNDSSIKVCLATEASGSSVNHFAQVPYAIYYSASYKWLDMQQSRGRTDRGARSLHSECFYKYLQVAGSMDSHVYRTALDAGADEKKLITAGVTQWLRDK